jgi:hypothetical protein
LGKLVVIPSISCTHNYAGQEDKKDRGKNMKEKEEKKEKAEVMMEEGRRKKEGVGRR